MLFYRLNKEATAYDLYHSQLLLTFTSKLFRASFSDSVDLFFFDGSEDQGFNINILKSDSDRFESIEIPSSDLHEKLAEGFDFNVEPCIIELSQNKSLLLVFFYDGFTHFYDF